MGVASALLGACALLVVFANRGYSATIQASGVTQPEVQAAIDAARTGDTVAVPAGSSAWTSKILIDGKGITLVGAGIGQTIITHNLATTAPAVQIQRTAGLIVRVTGFTFVGGPNANNGFLQVGNGFSDTNLNWRVDHIKFSQITRRGVQTAGQAYGLIDHCTFVAPFGTSAQGVSVMGDGANSWMRPLAFGTVNAVYIEDCVFDWAEAPDGAVDIYEGGRCVFRFNVVTNSNFGCHGADSGGFRSAHSYEVYGNRFYNTGISQARFFHFRGGTAVLFSNTVVSANLSVSQSIPVTCYRATGPDTLGLGTFDPWGVVTGTNPYDGNTDIYGYPALDQIGRTSPTTFLATKSIQTLSPMYGWSNTFNGAYMPIVVLTYQDQWSTHPMVADMIQENRDFYNNTVKPGYQPLTYPHPLITGASQSQSPTISDIPDQFTIMNTPTAAIPFTVADGDTALSALTLTGSSSNPTLVPANGITFGGSGGNRTVTVTPASGQTGNSTITVRVSDGTNSANDTFVLTVAASNSPPTISLIASQTINEDTSAGPISFTVGDAETGASSVTLSANSSNTSLVPINNITFGGSAASRTVTVSPAANQSGSTTITITASDGKLTATRNFTVTVNAVNDAPTISAIGDQTVNTNGTVGPISFTIGDAETAAASLTLSAGSSNPTLIPVGNIAFGGSGANRTVTLTPAAGQSGSSTITVTVSDGQLTTGSTFAVSVRAGATYYVDNNNAAANDVATNGSEAKPWRTINYAMSRIVAGDTILVKDGTYNEDGLYVYGPSSSAGRETVLKAYPGHRPIFKGLGNTGRIAVDSLGYLIIDGFEIWNLNHCVYIRNGAHHITVQNCDIHDSGNELVHVDSNSHDILVQNNVIHDGGTIGDGVNGEGIYVGHDGTPIDNTYNVTIRNNTIYNTPSEGVELKPGTHDCVVEYNNVYANNRGATQFGAIEVDNVANYNSNPNHIVRKNLVHDTPLSPYAIRAGTGCLVYDNIIYNVAGSQKGVYADNAGGDSYVRRIYHNTMWLSSANAVSVSGATVDVRNNIGPTSANNMGTNSAYFVNAAGGDFRLVGGAAPINAGVDLTAYVPDDFDGNSRTADLPPDIGAFEYAGGRPGPPPNLRIVSQQP